MTLTCRIEVNPRVMLGKPVIRGTRIPVELILHAAMRFAADTLAHEEVVFIGNESAGDL